jgi:hypothetical protein
MAKKNWIYIKRGLSEDPKHREALGMAVWLFMHICDAADFEKGIVYDWRDKEIAIDMTLSTNTVREWRARLVEKGYITCQQRQHGLDIIIHNWTNPRDYSGKKVNIQGESQTQPSEINNPQGEPQGESQALNPSNIDSAPFIESESESISLRTDEVKGKYKTRKLPAGSGIDWGIAAGKPSEEIAAENVQFEKEREVAAAWESAMSYNPLSWWSDDDLKTLLRFLLDKSPEDMRKFAEWANRPFSRFDPISAKRAPLDVITYWKIAVPESDKTTVTLDADGIPETY